MNRIRILLCCGAGMSSGLLAQRTKIAARKQNIEAAVQSAARSGLLDMVHKYDVILLAPHYQGELDKITRTCEPYHVPVRVIPKEYFGSLDGEGTLAFAMDALQEQ